MPLWLPEAAAKAHPLAVDRMLVAAGLEPSLTKARRAIADGAIYLNNERLIPPEPGFLPVVYAPQYPHLYEWIWDALREGAAGGQVSGNPPAGIHTGSARPERAVADPI